MASGKRALHDDALVTLLVLTRTLLADSFLVFFEFLEVRDWRPLVLFHVLEVLSLEFRPLTAPLHWLVVAGDEVLAEGLKLYRIMSLVHK